jgi:diguanylate cyclase (GGDEF)-like protein
MPVSIKRRADAALVRHVWAVGIAIAVAGGLAVGLGFDGWYPARLVWGAEQTWFAQLAVAAALASLVALVLLVRLRFAQIEIIRGARFLLPDGVDALTGLANRAAFNRCFDDLLLRPRGPGRLTLLLLDLDSFKEINDTHGHHAGDAVLAEVGRRLRHVCGPEPVIARLGGDEFAVLIAEATASQDVAAACRLIIAAVGKPVPCDGEALTVGISIGFLCSGEAAATRDDLMRQADRALYAAKAEGKNCAVGFDPEMDRDASQRRFLERELRGAIIAGEIDIDLQPILSADGEVVIGAEALARWRHNYRGRMMPGEFIALAETTGLIHQLGRLVLRKACLAAARWDGLFVSVNVSPIQMRRPDFVAMVQEVLTETGLEAERLTLEITESVLIEEPEKALKITGEIRALGVKIALDDFGTGFSALSYLRKFRLDALKIDRSFIADLDTGAEAASIVHCVVNLGRALGLKVVAEGVETAAHAGFLRAAGCHAMQGYLFGRPMSVDAFDAMRSAKPDHPAVA